MIDYKEEIRNSRCGHLGSSDGALLKQIAELGYVPQSAAKRMAVCKGLVEHDEIPENDAIRMGNEIEMFIYEQLKSQDERYESNPLWVSKRYAGKNVSLISHPDIVLKDDNKRVLNVYEVKCTKFNVLQTRHTYAEQLYIHNEIAKEIAKTYGEHWIVKLYLVHYSTDGLDLSVPHMFDETRLTINRIRINSAMKFDLAKAIDIVDAYLDELQYYNEDDEIPFEYLPTEVKEQFTAVANILKEIKERELIIDNFKKRLYTFLEEHGVKSIKNDWFSIVRVLPSVSIQFDTKTYLEDFAIEHPRKCLAIKKKYEKRVNKKGYVTIKLKDKKDK